MKKFAFVPIYRLAHLPTYRVHRVPEGANRTLCGISVKGGPEKWEEMDGKRENWGWHYLECKHCVQKEKELDLK